MRPCTPFAIYVTQSTIWEGSYFYCGGLFKDTFYGVVHHFFYSKRFSPDYCSSHMKLIHRMIQFYYRAFIENGIHTLGKFLIFIRWLWD